jgi:hypothetical protein
VAQLVALLVHPDSPGRPSGPDLPGGSLVLPLPVSVLAGLMMVRVFTIYHDYQHGTILRGSPSAGVLLGAYGLLLLTPSSIWRRTTPQHCRPRTPISPP